MFSGMSLTYTVTCSPVFPVLPDLLAPPVLTDTPEGWVLRCVSTFMCVCACVRVLCVRCVYVCMHVPSYVYVWFSRKWVGCGVCVYVCLRQFLST